MIAGSHGFNIYGSGLVLVYMKYRGDPDVIPQSAMARTRELVLVLDRPVDLQLLMRHHPSWDTFIQTFGDERHLGWT